MLNKLAGELYAYLLGLCPEKLNIKMYVTKSMKENRKVFPKHSEIRWRKRREQEVTTFG